MMALTGIVFSIAFVLLQFSAIAYSPRFASRFARDPVLYHALGVFFATFTFAIGAIAWSDRNGQGHVPTLSLAVATGLLFVSMIMFVLLIRRLADLQIGATLRYIGDEGREVIRRSFALPTGPRPPAARAAPGDPSLRMSELATARRCCCSTGSPCPRWCSSWRARDCSSTSCRCSYRWRSCSPGRSRTGHGWTHVAS
jgi:uncharacterized membrane protein